MKINLGFFNKTNFKILLKRAGYDNRGVGVWECGANCVSSNFDYFFCLK
jgi:hypothetical protein